ncbi:hypothetical protein FDECE_2287 [Fusarium decemcellulare]|nr:hypothetical protein FDECE_2287 [Fusarium decemcellulare]
MAAFVIVPGACTPPSIFQDFCDLAKDHGVVVVAAELATVGRKLGRSAPHIDEDVQAIRQAAEPLLDEGKQVILVTSSLGGVVGTQSLEALSVAARSSRGQKGGIQKIVYVTSLVIQPDTSPMDFFGPNPPPYTNIPDTEEYIEWTDEVEDGTLTFSDLPPDEARKAKAKMNRFHSKHSFHDRLTYPGYKHAAVHYVICEEDKILPKEAQLVLIESLKGHSPDGQVTTHSISAGHLPFVTRPAELFHILQTIASI